MVLHRHQDQHHHDVGQEEPGFWDLGKRAPRGRLAELEPRDLDWVTQSQPSPLSKRHTPQLYN